MTHMPQESPEAGVDAFLEGESLARTRPKGCASCRLPNAELINRSLVRFIQLRASGETTVALSDFHRLHLKAKLNYPLGETSLRRHMRNCLGI